MIIKFTKETKDDRKGRTKSFKEGCVKVMSKKEAKKYIDSGNAVDTSGKYIKKKKVEDNG
jgi:hypothetical protein